METNRESRESNPPWLVTAHGEEHEKHSFYSLSENRFYTTSIPALRNKKVFSTAYGWLVLVDLETDECCLWNPSSLEQIELPDLEQSSMYDKCILSKPPTDPDCHILFIRLCLMHQAFCQLGDDEFVVQSTHDEDTFLLAAASFKGNIYGLTAPIYPQFVTIHFMGKTLELRPILMEEGGEPWEIFDASWYCTRGYKSYLIESPCGNELLLVLELLSCRRLYDGLDLRVFRVDLNRLECVELESIGNRAIFLCHQDGSGGVCCSSQDIKANSIYFTIANCRNLYIYDMDDRSTTFCLPCPAARRSQSISYWLDYKLFKKFIT